MARKKAVKKYTLAEFKAWLEGIEEIQPEDWCPDTTQWKMIREKIGAIVVPEPVVKEVLAAEPPLARQNDHGIPRPSPPIEIPHPGQMPQSALPMVTGDTPLTGAGGGEPAMTAAAKAALAGKLPSELATDPSKGSKTPNIDTMNGNYESNFT